MNNVVEMVKDNLNLVVNETEAKIKLNKLPKVYADEHQMIQLMQNLIENSIKFRRGNPDITISGYSSSSQHVISVSDKGIGIEPQYHEKIFRIFQRLHRSDEYQGTGIGLSICKRIVERHNGKIWVESEPGKGTTFFFSLPTDNSERFR
jgi:light-regulated signal transduction histidine kinase (bacteriophytochrome)